ncbi:MAG: NAD-binding protein [Ignisphaera sp.]|nr:NAD-binding protein [Ignisphaera sp.]MCX8168227.1 NAD-binding protein [Ignisphaera sp.]MDW8084904.1 NAD-binding protein [Ignisphaera sp.]
MGFSSELAQFIAELVEAGIDVAVIDSDSSRVEGLRRELDIAAFVGNPLDLDLYKEVGMPKADVVIAAHTNDLVNIVVCSYAKHLGVPRIIVIVNNGKLASILKELNLANEIIIEPNELSAIFNERFYNLRKLDITQDQSLILLDSSIHTNLIDKSVEEIEKLDSNVIFIIDRENRVVYPNKEYKIQRGDKVFILTPPHNIQRIISL